MPTQDIRLGRLEEDAATFRERVARVEATLVSHEKAAEHRHAELKALLELMKQRQEATEARSWKIALGLVATGVAKASALRSPRATGTS